MLDVREGRYVAQSRDPHRRRRPNQQIGTLAAMQLPAGTKHIDLPGETLLPGLIDMHVHLTSLAEIGGYEGLKYTDSFWTAVGAANAEKTLDAGFTTVRNVGSSDFADVGAAAGDRRRLGRGSAHRPGDLCDRRDRRSLRRHRPAAVATTRRGRR